MKVALFGKIRSGKDTVGKILIKEYGFQRFAFGDGIGEIIDKYFPEARVYGKPRKHYQHIGQKLRELNPNVWINYLLQTVWESGRASRVSGDEFNVVITDGRQLNEAEKMKKEGYLIIKVTTPDELRVERMKALGDIFEPEDLQHETELQVDLIQPDVEIINDGSLEDLKDRVQAVLRAYGMGVGA